MRRKEEDSFVYLMKYYRVKPVELQNDIIPTLGCNFRCRYCFEKLSIRQDNSTMTEDQITTALNIIKKRVSGGTNRLVRIFGGEPLQPRNYPIVEKIFRFAAEESLALQFTTNGFHLLDYVSLFKQYRKVPLFIQVSLDGIAKTHNKRRLHSRGMPTFERIVHGIDKLAQLPGVEITIRHNIDKEIMDNFSEVIKFIKEKGWHSKNNFQFQLSGLFSSYDKSIKVPKKPDYLDIVDLYNSYILNDPELDKARFETTSFSSEASYLATVFNFHVPGIHTRGDSYGPRVIYCHAAVDSSRYVFSPDGYIYNCLNCIGNNQSTIGRYSGGKIEIDNGSITRWNKRTITRMKKCRDCEIASLCGGGCPAENVWKNGKILKPSCEKEKKLILLDRYLDEFIKQKLPSIITSCAIAAHQSPACL